MSEPIQSIAQNNYILATQQEVSHDNSLSGNGTVDSPLGVVPGYNETVLWSGNCAYGASLTANEPVTAFERYKVYLRNTERQQQTVIERYADPTINTDASNKIVTLECIQAGWSNNTFLTFNVGNGRWNDSWTTLNYDGGYAGYWYASTWNYLPLNSGFLPVIQKIVGINRKAQ